MVQFCFNYMYVKSGGSLVTLGKILFLASTLVPSLGDPWHTDTLWSVGYSGCWPLRATKRSIALFFLLYPQVLAQWLVQSRNLVKNSEMREIKQYLSDPPFLCVFWHLHQERKTKKKTLRKIWSFKKLLIALRLLPKGHSSSPSFLKLYAKFFSTWIKSAEICGWAGSWWHADCNYQVVKILSKNNALFSYSILGFFLFSNLGKNMKIAR